MPSSRRLDKQIGGWLCTLLHDLNHQRKCKEAPCTPGSIQVAPQSLRLLLPSYHPLSHLQQQQVIQVFLGVIAVLVDAPAGECLPGILLPEVIGPQHHSDSSGVPRSGWGASGEDRKLGRQWGTLKMPRPSISTLGGPWHCLGASLQILWGITRPLAGSPGAKRRPVMMVLSLLFPDKKIEILLGPHSFSGVPHFPLQTPQPSLSSLPSSSTRQFPRNPLSSLTL